MITKQNKPESKGASKGHSPTHPAGKVTINDIARIAKTSKTTVSFYLNGKKDRMSDATSQRIAEAIKQTGYAPNPLARGMNAKQSYLMGVVIGDITNAFSNQIVKGIGSVADAKGYRMLVCSSNYSLEDERAYIERLLAVGVDGFIVQPTAQFKEIAKGIEQAGKQLVFFDSKYYDQATNWVKTDNYEATYDAICSCIEDGYRRFVLVAAEPKLLSSRIERNSGFSDALEAHGISHERFVIESSQVDEKALGKFFEKILASREPTLVFAPNCWALPSVYRCMRPYYNRMPDNIGLLGFDNTDWVDVASPSVSTIEQPAFEEGREACRILVDLCSGTHQMEPRQVLQCNVRWRDTTMS